MRNSHFPIVEMWYEIQNEEWKEMMVDRENDQPISNSPQIIIILRGDNSTNNHHNLSWWRRWWIGKEEVSKLRDLKNNNQYKEKKDYHSITLISLSKLININHLSFIYHIISKTKVLWPAAWDEIPMQWTSPSIACLYHL